MFSCFHKVLVILGLHVFFEKVDVRTGAHLKVPMVFALELKLSKTLRGLVYFVLQL